MSRVKAVIAPQARVRTHAPANKQAGRKKTKAKTKAKKKGKRREKEGKKEREKLKPWQSKLSIPRQKASGKLRIERVGSREGEKGLLTLSLPPL